MSTAPATFGAPVLGQTEHALGAILERELSGTGLTGADWVALSVAAAAGDRADRDQLVARVASALKVAATRASASVDALAAAGLLRVGEREGSPVGLTERGAQLHGRVRASVGQVTERLWGDLPAEDLATAGRVLGTVLERANAELAGGDVVSTARDE